MPSSPIPEMVDDSAVSRSTLRRAVHLRAKPGNLDPHVRSATCTASVGEARTPRGLWSSEGADPFFDAVHGGDRAIRLPDLRHKACWKTDERLRQQSIAHAASRPLWLQRRCRRLRPRRELAFGGSGDIRRNPVDLSRADVKWLRCANCLAGLVQNHGVTSPAERAATGPKGVEERRAHRVERGAGVPSGGSVLQSDFDV